MYIQDLNGKWTHQIFHILFEMNLRTKGFNFMLMGNAFRQDNIEQTKIYEKMVVEIDDNGI